ncbi:hypothetical protein [Phnomibacter sp. MR]|uniref:hypothetical protein n=1 Tax=Phnomibacter sp. MR TaxID=3042318 RepID=UPI003A80D760
MIVQCYIYRHSMATPPQKIDVILDILRITVRTFPHSPFAASLLQQYQERGFLTRKQLEGLMHKASKVHNMPEGKLATLQAIIQKMPVRQKSEAPTSAPIHEESLPVRIVIASILEKYPTHKPVLLFKAKYETHTPLSKQELDELLRFYKLLVLKDSKG